MDRKIKIMQIIWGLERGGAELLLLKLSTELVRQKPDVQITVAVYKKVLDLVPEFERSGIHVICLDVSNRRFYKKIFSTYKLLKKYKPDILHTHITSVDHWAFIAALFAGVKNRITTIHNRANISSIKDKIFRIISSVLATKIIAVSCGAKDFYIKNSIYPAKKIDVIYNCPSFSLESGKPRTCPVMGKKKTIRILNIGNLRIEKGQLYLIRAMALLQESNAKFELDIYGKDIKNYRKVLEREVVKLGLNNVHFKGITTDIAEVLMAADLYIGSSLTEAMPLTVLEVMSAGLPLIASDISAHREVLGAVNESVLVEPQSPGAIARAVTTLLTSTNRYNEISIQLLDQSRNFSVSSTIDKYYKLYQSLVS